MSFDKKVFFCLNADKAQKSSVTLVSEVISWKFFCLSLACVLELKKTGGIFCAFFSPVECLLQFVCE